MEQRLPKIKICGLTTKEAVEAANGADYAGFIFYPPSPRHITPAKAAQLSTHSRAQNVAVVVDPHNAWLHEILGAFRPDYIQLHGHETPKRVQQIRAKFGLPIIKAFRVSAAEDIAKAHDYEEVADMLLFDARATGTTFDWKLLARQQFSKPWFVSGGLRADNVEEAMHASGAKMVDVSSSLESSPGIKDPQLVRAFVRRVKNLCAGLALSPTLSLKGEGEDSIVPSLKGEGEAPPLPLQGEGKGGGKGNL